MFREGSFSELFFFFFLLLFSQVYWSAGVLALCIAKHELTVAQEIWTLYVSK
jgi:hypothetical protein